MRFTYIRLFWLNFLDLILDDDDKDHGLLVPGKFYGERPGVWTRMFHIFLPSTKVLNIILSQTFLLMTKEKQTNKQMFSSLRTTFSYLYLFLPDTFEFLLRDVTVKDVGRCRPPVRDTRLCLNETSTPISPPPRPHP